MPRKATTTTTKPARKSAKTAKPAPSKAAKVAKSTKSATTDKPLTKAVAPPTPAPVAADTTPTKPESPLSEELQKEFSEYHAETQRLQASVSALRARGRSLERRVTRELRAALKAGQRRKRRQTNRTPSGFVRPTLISNELAAFLGKDQGTEMARTEVTREINAYIRANNLQDQANGRKINADSKLSSLLKLDKNDELTYFNLQKFMSPHFAKATKPAAAVTATAAQ